MGEKIATHLFPHAKKKYGYYETDNEYITWAIGHIVSLAKPQVYDPALKQWDMSLLPIIPTMFKYETSDDKRKQMQLIKQLADQSHTIVNCCDAGREGQYIHDLIYKHLNLSQPVQRLWAASLTPEGLKRAYSRLQNNMDYQSLYHAADCRSRSDWLVGMNLTRALSIKHGVTLHVGRVKTPTLSLIYDRTKEIESFSSRTYYQVKALFDQDGEQYEGTWTGGDIDDKAKADRLADKVKREQGRITEYEITTEKTPPPKLYDLSLLEQEASKKFNMTVKEVDQVAQTLYEKHEAITYPRTNSNYLTTDDYNQVMHSFKQLKEKFKTPVVANAQEQYVHPKVKRLFNNSKVEDHHAIIPTGWFAVNKLTDQEKNVYFLIVQKFLAQFFPSAHARRHRIKTEVESETFESSFKVETDKGWKVVYQKDKQEKADDELDKEPVLDDTKPVHCTDAFAKEVITKPPKPFTEATLIKAMESAGKKLDDEQLRDAMKESGLGTPATRSGILEELKKGGYIEVKKRSIAITEKGTLLIELIRSTKMKILTSAELTGEWEKQLNFISKGKGNPDQFMDHIINFTKLGVEEVKQMPSKKAAFHTSVGTCPHCGEPVIEGKKAYGCSAWKEGCKFKIWKESFRKKLPLSSIEQLLTKGETNVLSFTSKNNKKYTAKLKLKDKATGNLELEFVNDKKKAQAAGK